MPSGGKSQVRLIAGDWRGRKIPVPDIAGLRPTPDRIRETLFNWLANDCRGARVLDCFAGSGALGFEAASRRAKQVSLVEKSQMAYRNLKQQVSKLEGSQFELFCDDILQVIPQLPHQYDIVFIDPPYAAPHLRLAVIDALLRHQRLSAAASIYLEWPVGESFDLPLDSFSWRKQKKAGRVHYAIAEWRGSR